MFAKFLFSSRSVAAITRRFESIVVDRKYPFDGVGKMAGVIQLKNSKVRDSVVVPRRSKSETVLLTKIQSDYQRLGQGEKELSETLKQWWYEKALQLHIPPYYILSNKCIDNIAARKPKSIEELSYISGIGPVNINYAKEILPIVKNTVDCGSEDSPMTDGVWDVPNKSKFKFLKKPVSAEVEKPKKPEIRRKSNTVVLNDEQKKCIEVATKGVNLYITGSAGSGKR